MYFATTIAEKRITGKEKYTIGEMGEPAEGEERKNGKRIQKNIRKEDIYKEEIANGTICPVEIMLERLTKI